MAQKPLIIICAFNEEKWIGRTINLVKATKIDFELIVVNDGSTDSTAQIARKKQVQVIDLQKNVGKTNAFFAGIKAAIRKKPDAVVMLDADLLALPAQGLKELIHKAKTATSLKQSKMIIANFVEQGKECPVHLSGIRSFSTMALHEIMSIKYRGMITGFGLEVFLNNLFGLPRQRKDVELTRSNKPLRFEILPKNLAFHGREAYQGHASAAQPHEIMRAQSIIEKMRSKANRRKRK